MPVCFRLSFLYWKIWDKSKLTDVIDFSKQTHDEARDNLLKLLEDDNLNNKINDQIILK